MAEREKVINGLEEATAYFRSSFDAMYGTVACEKFRSWTDAIEQALALLKAQEPRVMTLEEVKMLDSDYYYLESMRSPGKELREIVGAYGLTCVTWPSITWARQTMGDSGYRKTWRCWTSRPTDEQREATPWN